MTLSTHWLLGVGRRTVTSGISRSRAQAPLCQTIDNTLAKPPPLGDPLPICKGEGKCLTLDTFPAPFIPWVLL